jgi:cytosine permease
VASAKPVPQDARTAWFLSTAPAYAGIMLWFVFWQDVPVGSSLSVTLAKYSAFAGGSLAQGLIMAFLGLIVGALLCYFLFYLVPGLLGMQTGLPLYIVGTSTYGVQGGLLMPGFLMGLLQFGWLGVNAFFASHLLCAPFGYGFPSVPHAIVVILFAAAAAFMGLKGIKYVAKVATFLPIIPLMILIILFVATVGGLAGFDPAPVIDAGQKVTPEGGATVQGGVSAFGIILLMGAYTTGFFATAGAAGSDFGMNNRHEKDVQLGGLVGIALAIVVTGGLALLVVAGAHGAGTPKDAAVLRATELMSDIMGKQTAGIFWWLLAIAAFPPACFSAFIAANSFKTTLPKVNPFISVGIGTLISIILAVTGLANKATGVFGIIGASFGPVCGAMTADYLLSGRKWAGPRAGWNLAGWISWVVGFVVGAIGMVVPAMAGKVPCPPVAAFVVGFVLYLVLAKAGLQSKTLSMEGGAAPAAEEPPAEEPEAQGE